MSYAEETPDVDEYTLEIVEGPEAGRRIAVERAIELGRDPEADVTLPEDDLVSRRHVRLTPADDGVVVEDLDSRNGTFVNGDEIHSPAHLSPGDQLLVGVTMLELRTPAQMAAKPTAVVRVPTGLTGVRQTVHRPMVETAEEREESAARAPSGLAPFAAPERKPDYVPDLPDERPRAGQLYPLLDRATKRRARTAPLAIIVLVAFVVMIYFATR